MKAYFRKEIKNIRLLTMQSQHYPPHLHSHLECIFVEKGSLALGQGQELYPMEEGDFALIFPNTIHHYQVFHEAGCYSSYLMASVDEVGVFKDLLLQNLAENPVIPAAELDPEVSRILHEMADVKDEPYSDEIRRAYLQIVLGKTIPKLTLIDKQTQGGQDMIFDVVSYISGHFREEITLSSIAADLAVSPYVLSRIFSGTFHTNFNTYVNEMRLRFAQNLLKYTDSPITDVAMDAGFSSQRTFNRFCKEKLHMSPKEYRELCQEQ